MSILDYKNHKNYRTYHIKELIHEDTWRFVKNLRRWCDQANGYRPSQTVNFTVIQEYLVKSTLCYKMSKLFWDELVHNTPLQVQWKLKVVLD